MYTAVEPLENSTVVDRLGTIAAPLAEDGNQVVVAVVVVVAAAA